MEFYRSFLVVVVSFIVVIDWLLIGFSIGGWSCRQLEAAAASSSSFFTLPVTSVATLPMWLRNHHLFERTELIANGANDRISAWTMQLISLSEIQKSKGFPPHTATKRMRGFYGIESKQSHKDGYESCDYY